MNSIPTPEEREAQAIAVINAVAAGKLLQEACDSNGITPQSFGRVLARLRNLAELYAQAQYIAADLMVDDTIRIADNTKIDPAHARNMMQARQWAASKRASKTYGDRLDVSVTQNISALDAMNAGRSRLLRPMSDQPAAQITQPIDFVDVLPIERRDEASRNEAEPDIFS